MEQTQERLADRLIRHFGGREKAAEALGVVGETLRLWKRDGIPLARAVEIEKRSGGIVTASEVLKEAQG